ncbi:MAG: hypothetical protein IIA82_07290 [Thaumarchaeota archaeon]|nr:hypothetical protein [Nitrososphaerota archaeon]
MGNKVICPLCDQEGYLVFETRKKKITQDSKIGELMKRNIRHVKYKSETRIRHPYASIVHKVKKNGKWKNISHYLGKITNIEPNLKKIEKMLISHPHAQIIYQIQKNKEPGSKLSDKIWEAFKESIEKAKYDQFKDMDNPTNQVIAEIIALRKIPYVRLHDNTENEYHCPHSQCNKPIKLTMKGAKITLEGLETIKDF